MGILYAKETFSVGDANKRRHLVPKGTLVDSSDPVVRGREHLFDPAEAHVVRVLAPAPVEAAVVEAATAAPGERRTLARKRPAKTDQA